MAVQDIPTSIQQCVPVIHSHKICFLSLHFSSTFIVHETFFAGKVHPFSHVPSGPNFGLATHVHLSSCDNLQWTREQGLQCSSIPKAQIISVLRWGSTHSWLLKKLIFHVLHWKSNLLSSLSRWLCMCASRWQHCENRSSPAVHYLQYQKVTKGYKSVALQKRHCFLWKVGQF